MCQNLVNLICGDRVQTASKGIQLNEIQILCSLHIIGGGIQPGVVHPLIIYPQRTFNGSQVGDGILSQHCDSIGVNQIRYPVMNLRVNVVRPSGQHNASSASLL